MLSENSVPLVPYLKVSVERDLRGPVHFGFLKELVHRGFEVSARSHPADPVEDLLSGGAGLLLKG